MLSALSSNDLNLELSELRAWADSSDVDRNLSKSRFKLALSCSRVACANCAMDRERLVASRSKRAFASLTWVMRLSSGVVESPERSTVSAPPDFGAGRVLEEELGVPSELVLGVEAIVGAVTPVGALGEELGVLSEIIVGAVTSVGAVAKAGVERPVGAGAPVVVGVVASTRSEISRWADSASSEKKSSVPVNVSEQSVAVFRLTESSCLKVASWRDMTTELRLALAKSNLFFTSANKAEKGVGGARAAT